MDPWNADSKILTANNVVDHDLAEILEILEPYVLEEIPEGTIGHDEAKMEIDRLLGRFANLYAYIITLWAHVSHAQAMARSEGDSKRGSYLTKMRDALWELSRAVKLKWQACSRLITSAQEEEEHPFERADYHGREEKIKKRRSRMQGWDVVDKPYFKKKK